MYSAARRGDTSEVRRLIRFGQSDKNEQNQNGWTPIIVAAERGYEDIVQALIAAGANINAQSNRGGTAVYEAARAGFWHIVRVLVRQRAQVYISTEDHKTALQYAVKSGANKIVSLLLDNGAARTIDECETSRGNSALHMAVRKNSLYTCRKLVARGARLDILNGANETPYDLATRLGRSTKMLNEVVDL